MLLILLIYGLMLSSSDSDQRNAKKNNSTQQQHQHPLRPVSAGGAFLGIPAHTQLQKPGSEPFAARRAAGEKFSLRMAPTTTGSTEAKPPRTEAKTTEETITVT